MIYISGPMRGVDNDAIDTAFTKARAELNRLGFSDDDIVNPWQDSLAQGLGGEIKEYLRRDLAKIIGLFLDILVLPGWQDSRGATLEVLVARQIGSDIYALGGPTEGLQRQAITLTEAARLHAEAERTNTAPSPETVLQEADRLVSGDRQASYGHPLDNFTLIADLWSTYLLSATSLDAEPFLTAEDVALMMSLLKISREACHPKRDNRVDAAGYLGCLDLIIAERQRRGGK